MWYTRSAHRRNHVSIFCQSVQGLQTSDTPKLPFPIDLLRRRYNSVRTAVRHCDLFSLLSNFWVKLFDSKYIGTESKWRQENTELYLARETTMEWLAMFWDTTDFCMKLLTAEWEVPGIPIRGRIFQMLRDLVNDGFVALKRAADDREIWIHRVRMSKTCCIIEDYWWWYANDRTLSSEIQF